MHLFFRPFAALALLLSIGCYLLGGTASAAEIYRYVDSNGVVHLTDRPPHDGYKLIEKIGQKTITSRIDYRAKDANRKRFSGKIAEVARQYQVPEALLHAVITIESA